MLLPTPPLPPPIAKMVFLFVSLFMASERIIS
jgi:hypothetical protein